MPETELLVRYKFVFLFIIILLYYPKILYSQVYPDKEINSALNEGINLIITQKYSQAEFHFMRLAKKNTEFPLWNLYFAAAKIAKAYDFGYDYTDKSIQENLDIALRKSEKLYDKDKENIWNVYFVSLSKGYIAYFNALNENWVTSLKYGLSSLSGFEECIKKDPNFYDAYTCIGIFKYWKSRKTEFLKWLPFYSDEKQKGLGYLRKAFEHNSFNSYLAVYNMVWILIDEGKNKQAVHVSDSALKRYPDVRLFEWGLARANESIDIKRSIAIYSEILNSLNNTGAVSVYKQVILKYTLARCYKKAGNNEAALNLCNEILNIKNMDSYTKKRLENRLDKVKELKKELSH
mgnify:CR=1 FL=1